MATTKVSALTSKTTPVGTEEFLINDSGTSKKITKDNITEENFTSTLKTKLDGIETSATADQTDAEIKTAYENNADTNAFTDADHSKLDGIESGATADQTAGEIEAIVNHDNLVGFSANEHIDWTADQGATNIHTGNYTDTTYSVGDGGLTEINFTSDDNTKLDGIETAATADQTGAEIKTLYEAEANAYTDTKDTKLSGIETSADVTDSTNVDAAGAVMESDTTTANMSFVVDEDAMTSNSATKIPTQQSVKAYVDSQVETKDALSELSGTLDDITDGTTYKRMSATEQSKLSGIEAGATADQTNAQIKTAYEANADTNEFSDAEQTKLSGIEANATADQSASEIKTAYESNADTNEFSDAEQTKLSGIEASADVTDSTNVDAAGAVMESDITTANMSFVVDEDDMASDDDTKVPHNSLLRLMLIVKFNQKMICLNYLVH